jgi:hypothetical protein
VKVKASDFANNIETSEITIKANPPPPPPPPEKKVYSLTIQSNPSSIQVLLDGQPKITPFTVTLEEGNYSIVASESAQSEGNTYIFSKWGDGSSVKSKAVTLSADTTLTLVYTKQQPPPQQEPPQSGIPIPITFTLIGVSLATTIFLILRRKSAP